MKYGLAGIHAQIPSCTGVQKRKHQYQKWSNRLGHIVVVGVETKDRLEHGQKSVSGQPKGVLPLPTHHKQEAGEL